MLLFLIIFKLHNGTEDDPNFEKNQHILLTSDVNTSKFHEARDFVSISESNARSTN